jgi:hypothetical protein
MANPEHERIVRDAVRSGQSQVDMSGFDLSGLRFSSIRLEGANLSNVDLNSANLSGGYFRGCNLQNARLNKAHISLGDFRDADLSAANLSAADFNGATLNGANLQNAILTRANFVRTRLNGVRLANANLDGTDFRGAQGLTEEQLASAIHSDKAILDERRLAELQRTGDVTVARRGRQPKPRAAAKTHVDLMFTTDKPSYGDMFLMCGKPNPQFPPTGPFEFAELADLEIDQVDDFFAVCVDGEPVIWIYPLFQGNVVAHHPGPFDGIRIELGEQSFKQRWTRCVTRFRERLHFTDRG